MTITAELFDGTRLEFPDGTAPEVIQRTAKRLTEERRGAAQMRAQPPEINPPPAGMALQPNPRARKSVADLRAMFPQYAQVSDGDFLIGLQRKFYPGMHPRQFMDSIDGATNAFTTITRPDFKEYWRTEVQKPMPGETPEQAGARAGGTSYGPANPGGQVGAGARSLLQGLTFGAGDEIVAAGASALGDNSYDYELAKERARLDQGRQDYTGTSLAAELGGALAVPLGAMKSTGKLGTDVAKSIGAGGALSGLYGFFSGEGGAGQRIGAAAEAGKLGAGIGAAFPVLGMGIQRGMNSLAVRKMLADAIKGAPTTEQLRQAGREAYSAVDALGVSIKPESVKPMADDTLAMMRQQGMDAGPMSLTPQSARLGEIIAGTGAATAPLKFSDLELLRRKAGIPASNMATPAESNIGSQVIGRIDDFVNNLTPDQVAAGDGASLSAAITKAREIWATRSKSQLIDDAVEASQDYLSGGASGIRNQFKRILSSPKLSRGFTDAEKALMRRAINGSIPEQVLNLLSGGLGQIATTAAGASMGGVPGAVAGMMTAGIARKAAEGMARNKAEGVRAVVANGGISRLPQGNPATRALVESLLRRGAAPLAAGWPQ